MVQHVRQEERERLVADNVAGAPDGMPETQRRLLAREARLRRRPEDLLTRSFELRLLPALGERALELELRCRSDPR